MKNVQHLSAIAVITIIMGLIYASVQQSYRSNANDPQAQIAYDLKDHLEKDKTVGEQFADSIDLGKSLAVFIATYNAAGRVIRSTGYLDGKPAQLPMGVINYAREHGEHWVTWQPRPGVRMAMVILRVNTLPSSFIVAGRSLKKVEERVGALGSMVFIGWLLCVAVITVNWFIVLYRLSRKEKEVFT